MNDSDLVIVNYQKILPFFNFSVTSRTSARYLDIWLHADKRGAYAMGFTDTLGEYNMSVMFVKAIWLNYSYSPSLRLSLGLCGELAWKGGLGSRGIFPGMRTAAT
jgi:hypothetical protein